MTFVNVKRDGYKTNDKIYTPDFIAKKIISLLPLKEDDFILDPFKGGGVFYDNFPTDKKDWCEIDEGKNFFNYNKKVDWIISNPPYSLYNEVMKHSYELADNICYLIPFNKTVTSFSRLVDMFQYGGIKHIWFVKSSICGFPFGFPSGIVWFQKGYKGETKMELLCLDNEEVLI